MDLETIAEHYPDSSWAIWSSAFPDEGCLEEHPEQVYAFIAEHRTQLNPNVVFLSLNPSAEIGATFANFHSPSASNYDYRLKEFIQENGLERLKGAYMTDLVKKDINPKSGEVNPDTANVEQFLEQLRVFDEDEYHVICFLEKAFEPLRQFFGTETRELDHTITAFRAEYKGTTLHCYRVWFYGNWGVNQEKVPELEKQLSYLDRVMGE